MPDQRTQFMLLFEAIIAARQMADDQGNLLVAVYLEQALEALKRSDKHAQHD